MKTVTYFTLAHPMSEIPEDVRGEGYSEDVLIDVNGTGKIFRVGWYDFDDEKWWFHDQSAENNFDEDYAVWFKLPFKN